MGEVIALKARVRGRRLYQKKLEEVRETLQVTAEELYHSCLNLAMLGA